MKRLITGLTAALTLSTAPAFAWGDVCKDTERDFHNEYATMNMCKKEGCDAYLHAKEAKKYLAKGKNAGCPWAFQ